jgi:nucleotidyltransferase/DNA polymerase involved in DNA repair
LLLGPPQWERPRVLDRTPEAGAYGVRAGMSMREATALCPEAVVLAADPVREAAVAERLLSELEALSPLVEPDPATAGCWSVDLRGLERRLGPPAQAAARLLGVVPPVFRPRVGVASGKFAARVATGKAAPGATCLVEPATTAAFLAGEPVSWLPLPLETVRLLERLGIETLGQLAALPGSAVAARFGPAGRRAWELAGGRDDEPVRTRPRPEVVVEALELPAPTTSRDAFLFALRLLAQRASERPVCQGRGARRVRLLASLDGGGSWEKSVTLKEPVRGARLVESLRLRFGAVALPRPVVALTLELSELAVEVGHQEALPGWRPGRPRPLVEAAQALKARYGRSPLARIVEVEPWSRIPERRHALTPFEP